MKLAIFGSRSLFGDAVAHIIRDEIGRYDMREISIVTSGKIAGVCKCAREIAEELSYPLIIYWADPKYARGMYDRRSRAILEAADRLLVIWDGKSRGTLHEIDLAKTYRVPYRIEKIAPPTLPEHDGALDFLPFNNADLTVLKV